MLPSPAIGFWLGDGGIASPRRGVRVPLRFAPGIGGRRRGAGDDMVLGLSSFELSISLVWWSFIIIGFGCSRASISKLS